MKKKPKQMRVIPLLREIDEYIEVLDKNPDISNISHESDSKAYLISFNYNISNETHPLKFFLSGDSFPTVFYDGTLKNIPHTFSIGSVQKKEFLCLFNPENLVGNGVPVEKKISLILEKIKALFSLSDIQKSQEFKKEYLYYWNNMSDNVEKYFLFLNDNVSEFKVETFKANRVKFHLIKSPDETLNKLWENIPRAKVTTPCLRINLGLSKLPLPPISKPWTKEEVLNLVDSLNSSQVSELNNLIIPSDKLYLVFSFKYPGVLPLDLLLKIEFNNSVKKTFLKKRKSIKKITHIKSDNSSLTSLFQRIGVLPNPKKVLLVGCGSLGSYISRELPGLGIKNITLSDFDQLEAGNIFRHSLTLSHLTKKNKNKSYLLGEELMKKHPEIKVNISEAPFDSSLLKEKYDLILINTGGVDTQIEINKIIKDNYHDVPILFNWIEYEGLGIHSLYVNTSNRGCFKCLYENEAFNKMNFYKGDIKLQSTGCGGTFNSYGNLALLKGTSMIVEIMIKIFNKEIDSNLLFSTKIENKNIQESNLSDRYFLSDDKLRKGTLEYIDGKCEVCNDKN